MENEIDVEVNEIDCFVGKKLREKRQKLSLTLMDVANYLGISHQQVQKYEQGKSRISAGTLFQLAQMFGVNSDYFFQGFTPRSRIKTNDEGVIAFKRNISLNILLVEDDAADEMILRKAISSCKHTTNIFCIHDGAKAIEIIEAGGGEVFPVPDIVLLDLNLPKRSGYEILENIKENSTTRHIPVIVVTNSVNIKDMVAVYKAHAAGYVCKSFDFKTFQDSIVGLINYWSSVVVLPHTASA